MNIQLREITIKELSDGYADNAEAGIVGYGGKLDIAPNFYDYGRQGVEAIAEAGGSK